MCREAQVTLIELNRDTKEILFFARVEAPCVPRGTSHLD